MALLGAFEAVRGDFRTGPGKKNSARNWRLDATLTGIDTTTEVCWCQRLFRGFGWLVYAGKAAPSRRTPKEIEWNH
jgi:hypothetical protein